MRLNAQEMEEAYLRAVASEMMREILRTQMKSMPREVLEQLLGKGGSRLAHFMAGGSPGEDLWNAGESFADGMGGTLEVEVEAVAINALADTFPEEDRPRIRRAIAAALRPVLAAEGRELAAL